MSVVNKMLNDLENREQNSGMSADYQPPEKRKLPLLSIMALLLILAGSVWAYFHYDPQWLTNSDDEHSAATVQKVQNVPQAQKSETTGTQTSAVNSTLTGSAASNVSSLDPSVLADIAKIAQQETRRILEASPSSIAELADNNNGMNDAESQNANSDVLNQISASETSASEAEPLDDKTTTETEIASNPLSVDDVTRSTPQPDKTNAEPEQGESLVVAPVERRSAMAVTVSNDRDVDIDKLKLSVQKALADKDTEQAIALLSKLLTEQPDNVNARKQLASLLFAGRESGKAETLLQYGLQRNTQQHDIRLMLARLYQQNERHSDALTLLQKVSPDVTLNIDYYNQRASLAQRLSQFRQASQDYKILANVEPEQAKWWLGLGVSSDRLNDSSTAILGYTRALSLNQLDAPVTAFMQQRLRGLGR